MRTGRWQRRLTCSGGSEEMHESVLLPSVEKLCVELLSVPIHEEVDGPAAARTSGGGSVHGGDLERAFVPTRNHPNERWAKTLEERSRSLVPIYIPAGAVQLPSALDPPMRGPSFAAPPDAPQDQPRVHKVPQQPSSSSSACRCCHGTPC